MRLERAAEDARSTGERALELRTSVQLQQQRFWQEPEGAPESLRKNSQEAISELEQLGDDRGLAEAWGALGLVHINECNAAGMSTAAERALLHARRAGDRRLEQRAVISTGMAAYLGPTPAGTAISRLEQLLSEAASASNRLAEAALWIWSGDLRSQRGEVAEGRQLAARGQVRHQELGHERLAASMTMHTAEIELRAGDVAAAEAQLRPAHGILEAMGEKGARCGVDALLAEALYRQNRLDEAEHFTRASEDAAASDDVVAQVWWRGARAKVLARRGDAPSALRLAREAVELSEPSDHLVMKGQAFEALGETLRLLGNAEEARPAYERAIELYEGKGDVVDAARVRDQLADLEAGVVVGD